MYNLSNDNRPFANVNIYDLELIGLLDSGANKTAINKRSFEKLKFKLKTELKEIPLSIVVKTAVGGNIQVQSCIRLPISYKKETKWLEVLVVPALSKDIILGMDFWELFGLGVSISSLETTSKMEESHVLSDIQEKQLEVVKSSFLVSSDKIFGRTHLIEHVIDTGDHPPIRQRPYQVSPYVQSQIDVELDRMLKMGVIEPSCSPWSSPIVKVDKKNGKARICLDSRRVNDVTIKESYPIAYINRILGRLKSTKYLSSIDLSDAYWQVPLHQDSRPKTAFRVPGRGLFQYCSMPMGLCNSASTLSKLMDTIFGCQYEPQIFVYLDDVIIATESFEEHLKLIALVSKKLKEANLTINLEKSKFCRQSIKYLGYILEEKGLRVDPDKVEVVVNYPAPKTVKEVRRFLGMTGWYQRFIPNYAERATPLTELTKKNQRFSWTESTESAFQQLKAALISAPVLVNPRYDLPFTIQCDASDFAVAGVITQNWEDGEHVVAYTGQKLNPAQRKYFACEKELLALLVCIDKFRAYVEGTKFFVITDNSAVTWLQNFKDPTGRLARWTLKLQRYDFSITHRAGKLNKVADALSRIPVNQEILEVHTITTTPVITDWYETLVDKVTTSPDDYPNNLIVSGKLYQRFVMKNGKAPPKELYKIVVPPNQQLSILHENHDHPTAAHLGYLKTLNRIKERYFWPQMAKSIRSYVKACERCKAVKYPNVTLVAPMGKSKEVSEPWQMVSIDFAGPFPRSKRGNTMLLVVTDWLSKYSILKPMRNMLTAPTVRFLEEEIFLVYGVPEVLISDNASQFTSHLFTQLLKKYKITDFKNARYFPQNNPTERVNRTIVASVRAYLGNDHREWDKFIPEIGCALRTSVHEGTTFSPFHVLFGRDIVLNVDQYEIPSVRKIVDGVENKERVEKMKQVYSFVKEHLVKAHAKSAVRYNLRTRPIEFTVGEIVWRKNYTQSDASRAIMSKLLDPFIKCKIAEKLGCNTYRLEDMHGKKIGVFHTKDLKKN